MWFLPRLAEGGQGAVLVKWKPQVTNLSCRREVYCWVGPGCMGTSNILYHFCLLQMNILILTFKRQKRAKLAGFDCRVLMLRLGSHKCKTQLVLRTSDKTQGNGTKLWRGGWDWISGKGSSLERGGHGTGTPGQGAQLWAARVHEVYG